MGFLRKYFYNILNFYRDGFRTMPVWGKKVWLVFLIKILIIFVVLKIFFFPDLLRKNFDNDKERGDYVLDELTTNTKIND